MNLFTTEEQEKIVVKICENPTIWDPRRRDYRLTPARDKIFMEIGRALGGRSGVDVSKCWIALREKYRRENDARNPLKKPSGSSTASQKRKEEWPLFEKMLFLKSVISLKRKVTETVNPKSRDSKVQILDCKVLNEPYLVSLDNEGQVILEEGSSKSADASQHGPSDKSSKDLHFPVEDNQDSEDIPMQNDEDSAGSEHIADAEVQATSDMGCSKEAGGTKTDKFPASRAKKKSTENLHQIEREKFLSIVNKAIEKKKTPASTIADHIVSRLENMSYEKQRKAFVLMLELLNKIEDDEI